jgi:hypothetical protein
MSDLMQHKDNTQIHTAFHFQMNFLYIKVIHNMVYKMFTAFYTVLILYNLHTLHILYVYDLSQNLLLFL